MRFGMRFRDRGRLGGDFYALFVEMKNKGEGRGEGMRDVKYV